MPCGWPRPCRARGASWSDCPDAATRTATWWRARSARRSSESPQRVRHGDRVSRLDATFAALRGRGERALVVYFTAGDPSLGTTAQLIREAERRGADVIELGVPFS